MSRSQSAESQEFLNLAPPRSAASALTVRSGAPQKARKKYIHFLLIYFIHFSPVLSSIIYHVYLNLLILDFIFFGSVFMYVLFLLCRKTVAEPITIALQRESFRLKVKQI